MEKSQVQLQRLAMSSTTSAAASATSSKASGTLSAGSNLKVVGIILALCSGCLIGSSFVFKKKGLLRSQAGHAAGEGVAYLKSPLWWTGMIMMILGELCNFAAYAFIEALVVTPLGALSVVISAILSSIFLNEKLSFFGWLGCGLCLIGSAIIALNGPQEETVGQIKEFEHLFLAPGFLTYTSILIAISLVIMIYFGPKYGKKSMLWYIAVCSMIGGISVSVTTGLGSAIVTTASGDNQFKYWFIYFLIGFVAVTLVTEVLYLNKALALFNTAMVTPTYYVTFTFCSMVTTVVLFQGLKASATQIITVVLGFFVICLGITILQMSKVDPTHLSKLDRRSTMLLQAARENTQDQEKGEITAIEDPGIDTLRGFSAGIGSIIRARSARRASMASSTYSRHGRPAGAMSPVRPYDPELNDIPPTNGQHYDGLTRHQLWDRPMPRSPGSAERISMRSQPSFISDGANNTTIRKPTIKFDSQDVVHQYTPTGKGSGFATHEQREAHGSPAGAAYPPLPTFPFPSPDEDSNSRASGVSISSDRATVGVSTISAHPSLFSPPLEDPYRRTPPIDIPATAPASYSFPSDGSSNSDDAPWSAEDGESDRTKTNVSGKKQGGSSRYGHSSRTYPRGEDDGEESVSLWQRSSIDDSSDDDHHGHEEEHHGSIRLVPAATSSGTKF